MRKIIEVVEVGFVDGHKRGAMPVRCSCGIASEDDCQAKQHGVIVREAENFEYAKVHRLRVDTYCMQHPDKHLVSAKSFAAHLLGMCIAMDYNNDQNLFLAIQEWEYGKGYIYKPPMLDYFGELTISHIIYAESGNEYKQLVGEWAGSVWRAYQVYHELAHGWLRKAKEQYYK